jgi:hypothetical protein
MLEIGLLRFLKCFWGVSYKFKLKTRFFMFKNTNLKFNSCQSITRQRVICYIKKRVDNVPFAHIKK